jgi:hypothetical protein
MLPSLVIGIYPQHLTGDQYLISRGMFSNNLVQVLKVFFVVSVGYPEDFVKPSTIID